ncbi:hypothetical protein MSAN_01282800 [Mycena sanguinolenta]|uniref:Uncharacterized protein n=1 Tax=Mycena sanguinolenta TaxID=230812 RepID=A0A8H6YHV9_9AGAR|nr:hypothetical protein MSAN_01282800 [Mycena sanguinolenta]
MAEKVNIIAQNERFLRRAKERLSTPQQYAATTEKFAEWLGNEKAYYLEARPWIVDLLLTADRTLRTHAPSLDKDEYFKIANAFIGVVRTVEPFQALFVEPNLRASVHHLLEIVAQMQTPYSVPPVPVHAPSTSIDHSQQMRPSSSSLAAALTPVDFPTSSVATALAMQPDADKPSATAPSVAPVTAPAPVETSVPAPQAKPKRKTKKKNISNLMQVDLQKYNEKRVTGQITQIGNSVSAGTISSPVDLTQDPPMKDETTPKESAASMPPAAGPSALPNSRSSSLVPKNEPTPTVVGSPVSLPSRTPTGQGDNTTVEAPLSTVADANTNKQLQSEDVEMMITTPSASVALSPAMNDKVNRVLLTLTGSSNVAVAEAVDPTTVKSDAVMSNVDTPEERPPDGVQNTSEGSMDMDVDTSQDGPANAVARSADLGAVIQDLVKKINVEELVKDINVEDVVNNVNRHIASNTADVSLELQQFSTADLPIPSTQELSFVDATPSSRTGLDAATVIVHHRGLASGSITMKFSINQNQMDAITKWNNRSKHSEDLRDSLCLSLFVLCDP